jgi:hypothetical protein
MHGSKRRHSTMWRMLRLGLCLAGLVGCVPATLVPPSHDSFKGIDALAAQATPEQPLRILLVHGMGTTEANAFNPFIAGTAQRLGLVQTGVPPGATFSAGIGMPNPIPIQTPGVPAADWAQLYDFTFAPTPQSQPTVVFTYLLWAPLTAEIKKDRLAEDGAPPRQWFSNEAKTFIDEKLGDVVLYGGTYRDKVMRPAVEAALCEFLKGTPGPNTECAGGESYSPTVVVTHSLGGYMLIDALDDELNKPNAANRSPDKPASAAARLLRNTRFVYMLANQIALLDLTTLDGYPSDHVNPDPDTCTVAPTHRLLDRLGCDWNRAYNSWAGGAENRLQIVAFSDPNDILSFLVRHQDIGVAAGGAGQRRYFTNVYMPNGEFTVPGIFSDPFQAHLGYLDNPRVLDLFVCGMSEGAVKQPCPPPRAP